MYFFREIFILTFEMWHWGKEPTFFPYHITAPYGAHSALKLEQKFNNKCGMCEIEKNIFSLLANIATNCTFLRILERSDAEQVGSLIKTNIGIFIHFCRYLQYTIWEYAYRYLYTRKGYKSHIWGSTASTHWCWEPAWSRLA